MMDSLSWAAFSLPSFNDGILVCQREKVVRVILPCDDNPGATRRLLNQFASTAINGGFAIQAAKTLESGAFSGRAVGCLPFDFPELGPFLTRVLRECAAIPRGEVRTYAQLAALSGSPRGARAVGQAMAGNPLPLLIPCHRVVPSAGGVGKFGGGPRLKEWLLEREGALELAAT